MTTPQEASDYGRNVTPSGSTPSRAARILRAAFSRDRLERIKTVISILIDVSRAINQGLAQWQHFLMPVVHHI